MRPRPGRGSYRAKSSSQLQPPVIEVLHRCAPQQPAETVGELTLSGELEFLAARRATDLGLPPSEVGANEQDHAASGHSGVPTFAFENEPFFGQDRIELLVWRKGLSRREK